MTTKVLNVFANLQTEFEEAHKSLKDVDDSIKKITGREPIAVASLSSQTNQTSTQSTQSSNTRNRVNAPFGNAFSSAISQIEDQSEEPQRKRRFFGSAFSRVHIGERDRVNTSDSDKSIRKPTIQSSVIAPPREVKPRTQVLEEQKNDKKSMERNKRMFGMILGTLQKFQSEESLRKDTQTQKRVEIEKKLDAANEEERAALRKERRELFLVRREKQAQIRRIEHKISRVEIHQDWEKSHQHLGNFIQTKTKPNIFYLPVKHNSETEKRQQETKDKYRLIVAEKRAKVQKELSEIDELYKKNEAIDANDELDEEMMETKENSSNLKSSTNNVNESESYKESIDDGNGEITDTTNNQTMNDGNIVDDASNLLYYDNYEKAIIEANAESLGDKEFEPIYDE